MTMSYKYIFTLIYMKRMYLIPLMWNNITTIKTTNIFLDYSLFPIYSLFIIVIK